jgi:hypothetical protein
MYVLTTQTVMLAWFLAEGDGENTDVFHSTHCEDIPDATSSQNGLSTGAHPKTTRGMAEETRSPAK